LDLNSKDQYHRSDLSLTTKYKPKHILVDTVLLHRFTAPNNNTLHVSWIFFICIMLTNLHKPLHFIRNRKIFTKSNFFRYQLKKIECTLNAQWDFYWKFYWKSHDFSITKDIIKEFEYWRYLFIFVTRKFIILNSSKDSQSDIKQEFESSCFLKTHSKCKSDADDTDRTSIFRDPLRIALSRGKWIVEWLRWLLLVVPKPQGQISINLFCTVQVKLSYMWFSCQTDCHIRSAATQRWLSCVEWKKLWSLAIN